MLREEIKKLIAGAIIKLQKEGKLPEFKIPEILVEKSKEKVHGDYSTNISLNIANIIKDNPMKVAELLELGIKNQVKSIISKVEIAPPGFINFFVLPKYLQKQVEVILKQKEKFGDLKMGKNKKVNIEFISANPTGPLTLGNGRGGFCGDVLANVLGKAGYQVTCEYYINDRGEQIIKLGHSVLGDEQAVYKGTYIDDLRKKILGRHTSQLNEKIKEKDPKKAGEKAAEIILKEMIKPAVKKMGIEFDVWFSEKNLLKKKEVDKALAFLKNKGLTYEKDKALWFKSTRFGDDKDRVLIKEDGEKTYLASDFAYLKNKFKRGFKKLVFFWGADHHGYIDRIKAAIEALGHKKEQADFIIMQMVRLFEVGKEVKMSKRAGTYITIDELINEVGLDAARFFFLTRSPNTHLNFDMDLAKEQSTKNPVYYIQYAYTRICSILKKAKNYKLKTINPVRSNFAKGKTQPSVETSNGVNYKLLNNPSELDLIKQLIRLPEIIEDTTKDYQIQRLPQYAVELADSFHKFYEDCKVISEDKNLTQARLGLVLAVRIILKNTLDLMDISAPEKM